MLSFLFTFDPVGDLCLTHARVRPECRHSWFVYFYVVPAKLIGREVCVCWGGGGGQGGGRQLVVVMAID